MDHTRADACHRPGNAPLEADDSVGGTRAIRQAPR
jgi:hypothetical protein